VSEEQVLLSADLDAVRTLTLNRPDRKDALNPQLRMELADALRAARDGDLRALVITGAGCAFCSGAEISTPEDIHPKEKLRRLTEVALALLAETIDAEEARSMGLVTRVKPSTEIDAFVSDLAGRLAAGPHVAMAQSKGLLNEGANATLSEALANEARAQPGNFATADSVEACAAFAEKRDPAFTGRWAVAPRSE
jgi:enoyl-CoA hydratase/carnithine racemase